MRSNPRLVRRNAMGQRSSSCRQTGRSPRARTASTRPRSSSFFTTFCAAPPLRRGGSIIPLRSGRKNHPLGLGESGRRQGRGFSGVAARPRAVTTVAPLRHQAGGAGSRRSRQPRTMTLPLNSQPKARPFCDHRRCRVRARQIRNLPAVAAAHVADNGLVAGSSPSLSGRVGVKRFQTAPSIWCGMSLAGSSLLFGIGTLALP